MLLMNPGLASRSTTGPKYLKGGAADPVPASGVDSTNAPATQPTSGITLAAKAPREDSAVVTGLEDESGSAGERASDFGAKGAGDQAGQGLGLPLEAPVLPPGAEMVLTEAASETVESAAPRLESGETLKPRLQAEPGVREPTPQPQKPKPQPQPAEARAPSERANAEDAEPKVLSETASQSRSRAEKTDTDAKYRHASADRLVRRLARLFENADFRGLATLFTVTAKTSNGVGATAVREGYKELFGTALGRRMIVSNIRWWNGANRQLIGEGQLRVGTRSFPWADWRYRSGRIELELVPWMGSYKVSRMAHRFYE
jgi:hypothetical protein